MKQQRQFEKAFHRAGDLYEAGLVHHTQYNRILPTGRHSNFALHFKTFINFWLNLKTFIRVLVLKSRIPWNRHRHFDITSLVMQQRALSVFKKGAALSCWQQVCQFGLFEAKFVIFGLFQLLWLFWFLKKGQIKFGFLAFFGELDFLCRFGTFKDDLGRFLGTGRFLDTVSGHRMINFHWKLCARICNFLFCLLHAFRFAVSGYSSAKPKVSRSLLVEWASFFYVKNMRIFPFKSAFGCFRGAVVNLSCFWCDLAFLSVDLAVFACDYLATLADSLIVKKQSVASCICFSPRA